MNELNDFKEQIHSCSKCGLCQSVCPIYKITGNDCTVSRGHFIMIRGLINGDLKMSKIINRYLDLCLKCSACSKFCPSGIDVVKILASAKAEYFKTSKKEKFISFIQKNIFLGIGLNLIRIFTPKLIPVQQNFTRRVIYFGGCKSKLSGTKSIMKIMNSLGVEVITPDFDCCGIPFYVRGDFENFEYYKKRFIEIIEKYDVKNIITTCASCEKTIKSYNIPDLNIRNIYEYIAENGMQLKLKKHKKVTFHKPCNMLNYEDIEKILTNTENLEYIEAEDFDKCCGFNGLLNFKENKIISKILYDKRKKMISTGAKTVLTSCLGCETTLKLLSFGKYKVEDLTEFLAKNSIN